MSGWLKLHRNIIDHWIFSFDEPDKALAWIYIITKANHTKSKFKIKNTLVDVDRGQLAVSQITLQKKFKWSQNKLKRFLKLLKNERMIDYETNALTTIITVCNYNDYQVSDNSGERTNERTNERPGERSANDQANDIKEGKNDKKEKKKNINGIPYQAITDKYNELLGDEIPKVQSLTDKRKRAIKKIWNINDNWKDITQWENYFQIVRLNDHVMGRTIKQPPYENWKASIEYILNEDRVIKFIEDYNHANS